MKTIRHRRSLIILGLIGAVGAALAPNGFFTGHRSVVLEVEIESSLPTVHRAGDSTLQMAIFNGTVATSSGLPISGAMVTAISKDLGRRLTVYTQPDGTYALPVRFSGDVSVRVRTPHFADSVQDVSVADGDATELNFVTEKLTDPAELSASLTSSAHAATIKWEKDDDRATFISQCNFCHQVGNELTRQPRTLDTWAAIIDRMEGYFVFVTEAEKAAIADRLHDAFQGAPINSLQTWDVSPALASASIEEWTSGDPLSFIHDADVGHDGRLYGADEGHDVLWILDRKTSRIEEVKLPPVDLPLGGKFSGLALPIGVFTGHHGPHSMAEDDRGRLWITNSLSSRLMAYTPEKDRFETYDVGADSMYLHTIRKDLAGRLWFTVATSNQVGRFDPETAQLDLLDLPANGISRWLTDALLPAINYVGSFFPRQNVPILLSHHKWAGLGRSIMNLPYGIDVNPTDGSIWYVKLYANKVGRIDPETFEIDEFDTPPVGPRRPRFAPNGKLWIPGFDAGVLLSLDPETREFTSHPLPILAPGEYEAPYALNVHPETGIVWLTSNMSDRIFSFDPETKRFTSFPLPTRSSYLRDIVFTHDGKICSSHSNLPSYSIEGGLGGFICLDPGA